MDCKMKPAQSISSLFSEAPDLPCSEVFKLGERVKAGDRLGKVAYIGPTDFEKGQWIGVILDKPEGKNNGSVKGRTYFKCPDKHGLFCRPNNLLKMNPSPRLGSPTPSFAGSMAPSIAASQAGNTGREHSQYAKEYGYDLNQNVMSSDGRTGKVKFLDEVDGQIYAGILFTKAVGDSDGTFQGIRFFSSYPKYSTFLPAEQVKLATTTMAALPPKTAPRETKASSLRKEKRMDGLGGTISSWRGSQESLSSVRSPKSPPPRLGGLVKQPNPVKDNEMINGLKKCLQEKEAHLTKMANELEEYRSESVRLTNENKNLRLRIGEQEAELQTETRLRTQLESQIDANEKRLDELSFCFTESECQKEELEVKLNELKTQQLQPLLEVDEDEEPEEEGRDGRTGGGKPVCAEAATQMDWLERAGREVGTGTERAVATNCGIQTEPLRELAKKEVLVGKAVQTEPMVEEEEDRPTTNESAVQTLGQEMGSKTTQTDPVPAPMPPSRRAIHTQTEQIQRASVELQTEKEKKSSGWAEVQTERLASNGHSSGEQTERRQVLVKFIDAGAQTETSSSRAREGVSRSPTPIRKSTPPAGGAAATEVLELNVMKLPKDADSSFGQIPTTAGQGSPRSLQKKYDEKCRMVETLEQTTQFLNSIIADQERKIEQLKRMNAETNGSNSTPKKEALPPTPAPKPKKPSSSRRLYCDHCQMFELHETVDCPKLEAMALDRAGHSALSPPQNKPGGGGGGH